MRWSVWIAACAFLAASAEANAASSDKARIEQLDSRVRDLADQVADLKRSQSAQYSEVQAQRSEGVQTAFKNGRPTFATPDGQFSLAVRTLVQFDAAYYDDGGAPPGIDFSSGSNFRRARLGVSGVLFKDWSYEFLYDLGGSGVEGSTISSAFLQYDGWAPFHFRIGAYAPPESFDDSTSASDLLFLERAQPADLARGLAGSDGRNAATIFAYDDSYFVAASLTAGLAGDAAVFDEQQALVGRAAYRLFKDADANFAVGGDATWLFNPPDATAGAGSAEFVRLRERPELNVDSQNIRLIDTGNIDAESLVEWGLEGTGNWHSLYAQGGYFGFEVSRRNSPLPDPGFHGWYAQASWVITGETKPYRADRGAYGSPNPAEPLTFGRLGTGAWELAARYSVLDLNDHEGASGLPTPLGGVRGGEQKIWTAGLNWYPNAALRFLLDYQHTDAERLNNAGADIGGDLDAISLRAQFAF